MARKRPKHAPSNRNTTISLVKNLKRFEAIFKKAKRESKIDLKKVNRIRKEIREGRYQIDYEKLAEKLLEDR